MKTFLTLATIFIFIVGERGFSNNPCHLIQFNPAAGATMFHHPVIFPFVSADQMENIEYAYQTLAVSLLARFCDEDNPTFGISPGNYHRRISNDGGNTWSAYTKKDFVKNAPTSIAIWYLGMDIVVEEGHWVQTYIIPHGLDKPDRISFSMRGKFTTDYFYKEGRNRVGDHVSVTSFQSPARTIYAYIYEGIEPHKPNGNPYPPGTLRAFPVHGNWRLNKRNNSNGWDHKTPPMQLPAEAD